ncbi:TOG array regulator of axonemal microtubules protein 1 [Anthophora plagiata]
MPLSLRCGETAANVNYACCFVFQALDTIEIVHLAVEASMNIPRMKNGGDFYPTLDDWRARVRGLERVASALRTSSALITIEPRLGSLLHAVLGCERSCRVAAAGLAVVKVVIAGVSEEALRKRLPQLAWGLARQGGPTAAQLARIAMLRLRPALLLEQLLQPQCLNARNARTRENTLQLLIFSLVTFPSTEFKVDTVANKVAKMVRDRRRRVRQAALDTLAVLAQIYESEEVLAAGKRASEGHHDGEAMMSAIRARLSRKSLPLVSADGLVMYGLQISPTVQIATGPDVDWIVAGSGSVSPGIGRTKGQIIATRSEEERLASDNFPARFTEGFVACFLRNENAKYRENPWSERPNFVTLGVGMRSKPEQQPVVWQMVPTQDQDNQCDDEVTDQAARNVNTGESINSDVKSRSQTKIPPSSRESTNYRGVVIENNFERRETNNKSESRIPVLYNKDSGTKSIGQSSQMDKSGSRELININLKRRLRDSQESSSDRGSSQEENFRSCGTVYHQKRRNHQENSTSMHYDNYRSTKNLNNTNKDNNNEEENVKQKYLDGNSRVYEKFTERDRFSRKSEKLRYGRSSSIESHKPALPRNVHQQTFVMHNMYSTPTYREGRFADENSFRTLQTGPTVACNNVNQRTGESNEKNTSRAKSHRKTKDAAAQKITEVQLISSDTQTSDYFPAIRTETPYRRRLRSLSPSQLYHRQQFIRAASNEVHALSLYDIDKAVNEEEYNEKNKHHFLPDDHFGVKTFDADEAQYEEDQELSSSDPLENNYPLDVEQDVQDTQDDSDSRSSSPEGQNVDTAFDIITGQSSPPSRDTVDFIISLDQKIETGTEATITSIDDDGSKDWSSEDEPKSRNHSRTVSRASEHLAYTDENQNESEFSTSDETGRTEEDSTVQENTIVSVLTPERTLTNESLQTSNDILHSDFQEDTEASPLRRSASPKKTSRSPSRNSIDFETSKSPRRNSRSSPRKLSFDLEDKESVDSSEERSVSPMVQCDDNDSVHSEELANQSRRESKSEESPAIIIASRPHSSTEVSNFVENHVETTVQVADNDNAVRFVSEHSENNNLEDQQSRDSSSETNTEPGILKIETQPVVEQIATTKRISSRVPRVMGRNKSKGRPEKPEKMKPIVQQCFAQLDSKDWEITMKGLKTLSHIVKEQPEYLDVSAAGMINRLLGRQVKSLRSQVARTACLAAGDIFSSQIRGIDQDFDDIAGPLLHRTADTNRFLRADSNAALDKMVEHLPPHRTIAVIVQRGASHQNAIVRAATARLLASVVDRIGPEHTLSLPRDVKDKLLSTGARLLIDGNLDARNHAKRMFRCLMHCEGFRKTLTDAVPETTLRHIDKTLKTL